MYSYVNIYVSFALTNSLEPQVVSLYLCIYTCMSNVIIKIV